MRLFMRLPTWLPTCSVIGGSTLALVLAMLLVCTAPADAQMFSYASNDRGRAVRSLAVGLQTVDFRFAGSEEPVESFDFQAPAYGITFSQPNLQVSVAIGSQSADPSENLRRLELLDADAFFWGRFLSWNGEGQSAFLPIIVHTGYRRVDEDRGSTPSLDAFNISSLGIGTGVGYRGRFSEAFRVEARATPIYGLAIRDLEGSAGTTSQIDADLQAHLPGLFGRVGLTFGYNFRIQNWNVDASELFPEISDELLDYENTQHLVRVGINW